MKTLSNIRILLLSFMLLVLTGTLQRVNAQPGITVSFQQFYDELSPYGEWVNDPEYGYVWVPNVEPDFQPYATNGRWVMTDYGNTWVSNYNWGWAPFHYGRWNYHNRFGWSWVPGYEWGPAWVHWRTGGGYYGWAPLGPGINIGISVNVPTNYWVFVPQRYLLNASIHRYYAPRRTIVNVYNRTTIINNTYVYNNRTYVSGPRRTEIQRVTRGNVPVHRITNANRPGSSRVTGRSVEIYRPNVSRNEQARPSRISTANSVRPSTNTNRNGSTGNSRTNTVRSAESNRENGSLSRSRGSAPATRPQTGSRENNSVQRERQATGNRSTRIPSRENNLPASTSNPSRQQTREVKREPTTRTRAIGSNAERSRSTTSSPRVERSTPQRVERSSSSSRSTSPRRSEGSDRPSRSTRG